MTELKVTGKHEAKWVTISTDEYDSMKSTIEVLSDPELMGQLKKNKDAINKGKVRKWDDFMKEKGVI